MFGEFFLERGLTNFQSRHLGKRPLLLLDLTPEIWASGAHSFSDLLAKRLPDFNRIIALQLNYRIGKGKKLSYCLARTYDLRKTLSVGIVFVYIDVEF